MVTFGIGFLAGIILTSVLLANKEVVQRTFHNYEPKLRSKAEIFEPISPITEAITEVVKENERRGQATKLDEL